MLVLTRKKGESLLIGKDIVLSVVEIVGDHVRIGITAPKTVSVIRSELMEETRNVNRESYQNSVNLPDVITQILNREKNSKTD